MRALLAFGPITLLQLPSFGLTASLTAPTPHPGLLSPNEASELTAALNLSQPPPLDAFPPSPFDYIVPHSDVILSFEGYRGRIGGYGVTLCLLQAANEVSMHFGSTQAMGRATKQVDAGTIRLKLYPVDTSIGGGLTWAVWATAIRGITDVVTTYGYGDMDFYIWKNNIKVGGGLISDH